MSARDQMIELITDALHNNVCDQGSGCDSRPDYRDDAVAVIQALEDQDLTIVRAGELRSLVTELETEVNERKAREN